MEFTEHEVREKLRELGYSNIPPGKLREFMHDLHELVEHDLSSSAISVEVNTYDESSLASDYNTDDALDDSYFQRSVPLQEINHSRPRSAFCKEKVSDRRFHVADDKENTIMTHSDITLSPNSSINESRVKRKVARRKNGETRIFDETLTDTNSETADITVIEEQMRNLPLTHYPPPRSYSAQSQYSVETSASRTSLPAFIRTSHKHPHTKRYQKCDPVNRYHQFRSEWQNTNLPGESKHSSLRWKVREQMLSYETYEKPRRNPTVNKYVVPTEKKRQALRWQVRTALAKT